MNFYHPDLPLAELKLLMDNQKNSKKRGRQHDENDFVKFNFDGIKQIKR